MALSQVSLEIIDKWLHSKTENSQSVIDVLINMDGEKYYFYPYDFKKFEPSASNIYRIRDALNKYFKEHGYHFWEAYCNPYEAYIVTRPLFCPIHKTIISTEFALTEHQDCLSEYSLVFTNEQEEYIEKIIIENNDPAEIEKQRKKREEEIKARKDS